jgi:hypothetical protein
MNADDLDALEESLGIVLPASYSRIMRRLDSKPLHGPLAELVCTDAAGVLSLNESVSGFESVAGFAEWPDELVVIGEDGVGNYYAIRHDEDDSAVLFFDHERNEIQQCAESLDDFCKRIRTLAPFDERVLHRSRRRAQAASQQGIIPDFAAQPGWSTDWAAFVTLFAEIVDKAPRAPRGRATVKRLNESFGSHAVRWTGRVVAIKTGGKAPNVEIDMSPTPETRTERFRELSRLVIFLRLGRSPGLCMSEAGTPQIVTTRDAWRDVRRGDRIQFLLMIAPGYGDEIGCIDAQAMSLHDCGGHLLKVLRKPSSRPAGGS